MRRSAANVPKSAWTKISVINSETRMSSLECCEVSTSSLRRIGRRWANESGLLNVSIKLGHSGIK